MVKLSRLVLMSTHQGSVKVCLYVPKQENPEISEKNSCWTLGSECNGGFAQYTAVRSSEAFVINSDWSATELGSIPCAYSTAEGLLHRSKVEKKQS
ncbi:MAG: hypothetical protein Ct9H300mP28_12310 [Pseudomonadota bacterium]|nr:MAG: hypothetical protein Ct9H300mP28_12310 [Pseudomonadota bacterium]